MRRGHKLEQELGRLVEYFNSIGVHAHKNHVKRTVSGVYLEGEPFDYEIFKEGKLYCFDAKECQGDKWPISNGVKQLASLRDLAAHGAEAFFLVWFVKTNQLIRFDIGCVFKAIDDKKTALSPQEGVPWKWEEL